MRNRKINCEKINCEHLVVTDGWREYAGVGALGQSTLAQPWAEQEQPQAPGQSPENWGCGCSLCLPHLGRAINSSDVLQSKPALSKAAELGFSRSCRWPLPLRIATQASLQSWPFLAWPFPWCWSGARLSAGRNERGSMGLCQFSPAMDLAKQAPPPLSACSLAQGSSTSSKSPIQMILLMCKFLIQRKDKCW